MAAAFHDESLLPSFDGPITSGPGRHLKIVPVTLAERLHPFPSRTRKLSSPAPKILGGQPPGKIGRRRDIHYVSPVGFAGGAVGILRVVESICPLLGLQGDRRSVIDGID